MNVTYAHLTDGSDAKQRAEFDMLLAPPELKVKLQEQANMDAMKELQAQLGGLAPPRRPRV